MEVFPETPESWRDEKLAAHIAALREFRTSVYEAIEPLRKDGVIRSSLEAKVTAPADDAMAKALTALGVTRKEIYDDPANPNDTFADMLIISDLDMSAKAKTLKVEALSGLESYRKCERSWKYFKPSGDEDITARDAAAVAALG